MRGRPVRIGFAVFLLSVVFSLPAAGQGCPGSGLSSGIGVWLHGDAARWNSGSGIDGVGGGAGLDWTGEAWHARGTIRHHALSDAMSGITVVSAAASRALPLPGRPCVGAGVAGGRATGLGSADVWENLTVPVFLGFDREILADRLTLLVEGRLLISWTSATLFSFSFREQAVGFGGLVGVLTRTGPFRWRLAAEASQLAEDLGPHPLGDLRMVLSLGLPF